MIALEKRQLPLGQESKLRTWLSLPQANILRQVVTAQCQLLQAEALANAVNSEVGDQLELVSRSQMKSAARYAAFIEIFDSLAKLPADEHFYTAVLPATTHANNTYGTED